MIASLFSALLRRLRARLPQSTRGAQIVGVVLPLLLLLLIGTLGFRVLEGWVWLDALYATVITVTTVGYGDITPATRGGRLFAIFFTLGAVGLAGYAISTLAAAVIEKQSSRVERRIRRRRMQKIAELNQHIIICGATVMGQRVGVELLRRKTQFVLIEADPDALRTTLLWMNPEFVNRLQRQYRTMEQVDFEDLENRSLEALADAIGAPYLLGSPTDEAILLQAGIGRARGLIPVMKDDRDTMAIILSARDMVAKLDNRRLRIVAGVNDAFNVRRIYLAGADKITAPSLVGGLQLVDHMLNPLVGEIWDQMLFNSNHTLRFTEWRAADYPAWIGRTVQELHTHEQLLTLAIHRGGQYLYTPALTETVRPDDIVITLANPM